MLLHFKNLKWNWPIIEIGCKAELLLHHWENIIVGKLSEEKNSEYMHNRIFLVGQLV